MTLLRPPSDLEAPQLEAFGILADLAATSLALRGVCLHPIDSILLGRIAQVVVLARQRAEAGKLTDAVEFAELARELAREFWLTVPSHLLPAIGRA